MRISVDPSAQQDLGMIAWTDPLKRHISLFRSSLAIRNDSHLQTIMQLVRSTVGQTRAASFSKPDAHSLSRDGDPSKMQLLVQMRCQSKGQISAAILTSNNSFCLYENRRKTQKSG